MCFGTIFLSLNKENWQEVSWNFVEGDVGIYGNYHCPLLAECRAS